VCVVPEPGHGGLKILRVRRENKLWRIGQRGALAHFLLLQLVLNAPELLQRGFQALHNLPRQNCRIGQVAGVLQAPVLEPEDVQAGFIPFHQIVIAESPEALCLVRAGSRDGSI